MAFSKDEIEKAVLIGMGFRLNKMELVEVKRSSDGSRALVFAAMTPTEMIPMCEVIFHERMYDTFQEPVKNDEEHAVNIERGKEVVSHLKQSFDDFEAKKQAN